MQTEITAEIRQAILKGMRVVPVSYDDATVDMLTARVLERSKLQNPNGYAFVVARNWAIDTLRTARWDAKRKLQEALQVEEQKRRAEAERREAEMQCAAEAEFHTLRAHLVPTLRPSQWRHLDMVYASCIRGMSDAECAALYPGTTREARYQWKHRGIALLWPFASDSMRHVISRQQRMGA